MWRFFFLIAVAAVPMQGFGQQAPPLSAKQSRIGDTISAYEREYFGLFSRTKDFAYATIGKSGQNGQVTVYYTKPEQAPTTIVLDPLALQDLNDFANNYEYYAKDAAKKVNPHRLMPLDVRLPLVRYERNGREVEVRMKNGSLELGEIFSVSDSSFSLWTVNLGYDWEFARNNVKVIPFSEIEKVLVYKRVPFQWIGGALGAVTALALASTGNYYPNLENEAASTVVMTGSYFLAGFGLGYGVESLFQFKKKLRFAGEGNTVLAGHRDYMKKRAMFPDRVPPEFAR